MLFTPYADADVAALTRAGLQQITRTAYHVGESVAATLLPRQASVSVAWPADGAANASTLTSLAHDGGASTVVLNSGQLPSSDGQYDNALNATTVGDGTAMGVLLADSGITGLLGSVSASSPARAQFDAAQDFLADTAMILAEAPYLQRSLVIAPPRHWDPSAAEAGALLSMTYSAPWLHKTGLSSLAAAAARLSARAKVPATRAQRRAERRLHRPGRRGRRERRAVQGPAVPARPERAELGRRGGGRDYLRRLARRGGGRRRAGADQSQ